MTLKQVLDLHRFRDFSDHAVLLMRVVVGTFLIWGVWDNIQHTERMQEFVAFLDKFNFPAPELMAPVSVWVQFAVGVAFISGWATRWAGLLCAINFIVAIAMVDRFAGIRGMFPSACLVLIGVLMATYGSGRFGLDRVFDAKRAAH